MRQRAVQTSVDSGENLRNLSHATVMIDLRQVEFNRDRLAPIVLALAEIPSFGGSIALLVNQSTHHIACMISVLAGAARKNVGVFRCPDEARDWLQARQVTPVQISSYPHKSRA
jgi:alpha/beta superfamily hydrolase